MKIEKTNEKVLIWMNRNDITGSQIAEKIGITRQGWAKKMKENRFQPLDMAILKNMGFNEG
jgi:predicted transcriptional regulator